MFSRFVSRFALPIHLAVVAALPAAMVPFVTGIELGRIMLWVSVLGAVWTFAEPALRVGERIRDARRRVRREVVRDPFVWFLFFVALYAWIQWGNNGIAAVYDPEKSLWSIREAVFEWLPASVGDEGFLPFATAVSVLVVTTGVLHALGKSGRSCFALSAALIVSISGICTVCPLIVGATDRIGPACADFGAYCFPGVYYAGFLALSVAGGVAAEEAGWSGSRFPFAVAVAGNLAGTLFFLPPFGSLLFVVPVLAYTVFALFRLKRIKSAPFVARAAVMIVFGTMLAGFALLGSGAEKVVEAKRAGLVVKNVFTEERLAYSTELTRVAREMWLKHPWIGNGIGAFGVRLPYLVNEEDWERFPANPIGTFNGYAGLLVERGIVGCAFFAVTLAFFLLVSILRGIGVCREIRRAAERVPIVFVVSAGVWSGFVTLLPFCVFAYFSAVYMQTPVFCGLAAVLAYAAASFPPQTADHTKAS